MDDSSQFYQRPDFWRKFIFWGFIVLFVAAFWPEVFPLLKVGWAYVFAGLICLVSGLNFDVCRQSLTGVVIDAAIVHAFVVVTVNIIVYISVTLLAVSQVAQFALPVRTPEERWKAFNRLLLYLRGRHGPAIFIKEGVNNAREDEAKNIHPGVALVDLSSAIVLEQQQNTLTWQLQQWQNKQTPEEETSGGSNSMMKLITRMMLGETPPFVRVAGPGIVFTEWGEKVHSVVDLRKQFRIQGETRAHTRDGIELKMPVLAIFSLSETPEVIPVAYIGGQAKEHLFGLKMEEDRKTKTIKIGGYFELDKEDAAEIHAFVQFGRTPLPSGPMGKATPPDRKLKTPYPFHENRVFAAAYAQALMSAADPTPWHELPLRVAIDIFRTEMEQYSFDDLNKSDEPKAFPMGDIKEKFSRQVRFQGLLSYKLVRQVEENEPKDPEPKWDSKPFEQGEIVKEWQVRDLKMSPPHDLAASKVLRDRGIRVIAASFPEFRVADETIKQKLIESWKARWERDIEIAMSQNELEASRERNRARALSQREMTFSMSNLFKTTTHSKEALALRIFQALEEAATNPANAKDLSPKEIMGMLQNLHRWLLLERTKK